jgi:hypothetical protein
MSWGDPIFPVVFGSVAGQLEEFGGKVLQNGAEEDGGGKAYFGRVETGF